MTTMTCIVATCAAERVQLERLQGRPLRTSVHVCLPCQRPVCGIHSYAVVTRPYAVNGEVRFQKIVLEPPVCRGCLDRLLPAEDRDRFSGARKERMR
jgi:hypothetical protein